MTENEAMKNLETLERFYRIAKSGSALHEVLINFVTLEDLVVAIQALEEIQEYRAIGTVEQLEWCKDASHWKELFKEKLEKYEAIGTVEDIQEVMALCKSLQETTCKYMDIGTIEEFQALKEKNEPKKIDIWANGEEHCPFCDKNLTTFYGFANCFSCGQKLDWE